MAARATAIMETASRRPGGGPRRAMQALGRHGARRATVLEVVAGILGRHANVDPVPFESRGEPIDGGEARPRTVATAARRSGAQFCSLRPKGRQRRPTNSRPSRQAEGWRATRRRAGRQAARWNPRRRGERAIAKSRRLFRIAPLSPNARDRGHPAIGHSWLPTLSKKRERMGPVMLGVTQRKQNEERKPYAAGDSGKAQRS